MVRKNNLMLMTTNSVFNQDVGVIVLLVDACILMVSYWAVQGLGLAIMAIKVNQPNFSMTDIFSLASEKGFGAVVDILPVSFLLKKFGFVMIDQSNRRILYLYKRKFFFEKLFLISFFLFIVIGIVMVWASGKPIFYIG